MIDFTAVKKVVLDLISVEKRTTAFEILDFYYKHAKTPADFDVLGECAIKAEHRTMYLNCALSAYALCKTSDQLFAARTNLYKVYNALNEPEKALFYIELNLKFKPNDFDLLMNRAFNLSLMNKKEEAEAIIESLIADKPKDDENIDYALSGKYLRTGHTTKGILNFIDTFKPKNTMFEEVFKMEKWIGQYADPGRTIYVNGEGGIGDEIINIRFFDNLKAIGLKPILFSSWAKYREDIVELFRRHGHDVITHNYSIRREELWTNMMPLPGYLNLTEDQLWTKPYLFPLRNPKNKINNKKFKIGIKCNGNPYFSQDVYRSIPIETMLKYLDIDNVDIYYFDKDKTHPKTISMKEKLNTWDDTLDYIDQMDMIVSSCTSLVHAAGAMGKRTIVIVPIAEYYTWTSTRTNETTPWYGDNFTVLKQSKLRSWHEPLARMNELVKHEMKLYGF